MMMFLGLIFRSVCGNMLPSVIGITHGIKQFFLLELITLEKTNK